VNVYSCCPYPSPEILFVKTILIGLPPGNGGVLMPIGWVKSTALIVNQ
jgi:hypothetical protein